MQKWLIANRQLARKSICHKWCANIISSMKKMMGSQAFVKEHRKRDAAFTRERILPLPRVLVLLMNQLQACLQTELDHFFQVLERADVAVRRVTKSALCQVRKLFSYRAFVALNRQALDKFYACGPVKRWRGYRLIAFDGSTHRLPQTARNRRLFGLAKGGQGKSAAVARVSCAYDVLNDLVVDAYIAPYRVGERRLLVKHLERLGPQDLALMDQGYVATWVVHLMQALRVPFCCRVWAGQYKATQDFCDSHQSEATITLPASQHSKATYEALGLDPKPIQVRIVRVETGGEDDVFLLTSLPDSVEALGGLYRDRWQVEELYKRIKCRMEVENFSGRLPHTIYQDFHATILIANLVSLLSIPARESFAEEKDDEHLEKRLNWTQAIGKMRDAMVLLFTRRYIGKLIQEIADLFLVTFEVFRPDRHFPRNHHMNKRVYYMAYKPAH